MVVGWTGGWSGAVLWRAERIAILKCILLLLQLVDIEVAQRRELRSEIRVSGLSSVYPPPLESKRLEEKRFTRSNVPSTRAVHLAHGILDVDAATMYELKCAGRHNFSVQIGTALSRTGSLSGRIRAGPR